MSTDIETSIKNYSSVVDINSYKYRTTLYSSIITVNGYAYGATGAPACSYVLDLRMVLRAICARTCDMHLIIEALTVRWREIHLSVRWWRSAGRKKGDGACGTLDDVDAECESIGERFAVGGVNM